MTGHLRKRGKDGQTWAIVISLGRDADGKPMQKWHTFHGKKTDAEIKMADLVSELRGSGSEAVKANRLLVKDILKDWLELQVKPFRSPRTYERYEEAVRLHLRPALGNHLLSGLDALTIERHYIAELRGGRKGPKAGGPLSLNTVALQHTVLKLALKWAKKKRLIARNPMDDVEFSKGRDREMHCLDELQVAQVLAATNGTRAYLPILLALMAGLRRNEILALRWQDVDLDTGKLAVRQSLIKTKEGGIAFGPPKSARSRRVVDLPALAVEALVRHKGEQARTRLLLGEAYQDNGLVVPKPDGTPQTPSVVGRMYHDLARKLGLDAIRFHDLRHTHATLLFRQGENSKVVAERLGHSSTVITLDRYSHVLPDMQADAARRLDATLRKAIGG